MPCRSLLPSHNRHIMEREIKSFETKKSKTKIVFKKYINGREKRAINAIVLNEGTIKDAGEGNFENMPLNVAQAYKDEMVKQLVLSVGDIKENVFEAVLDLPASDCEEVYTEAQKIFIDEEYEQKKGQ